MWLCLVICFEFVKFVKYCLFVWFRRRGDYYVLVIVVN